MSCWNIILRVFLKVIHWIISIINLKTTSLEKEARYTWFNSKVFEKMSLLQLRYRYTYSLEMWVCIVNYVTFKMWWSNLLSKQTEQIGIWSTKHWNDIVETSFRICSAVYTITSLTTISVQNAKGNTEDIHVRLNIYVLWIIWHSVYKNKRHSIVNVVSMVILAPPNNTETQDNTNSLYMCANNCHDNMLCHFLSLMQTTSSWLLCTHYCKGSFFLCQVPKAQVDVPMKWICEPLGHYLTHCEGRYIYTDIYADSNYWYITT